MNAPRINEHFRLDPEQRKVTVINDPKIVNGSIFYFAKEDHTLGNSLRMSLLRDKDVRFAGYRMPHPLQYVCEMKVQTSSADVKPLTVMISALEALETEFSSLEQQFKVHFAKEPIRHSMHAGSHNDDIMQLRM